MKPGTPPPGRKQKYVKRSGSVVDDSRAFAREKIGEEGPYLKFAFANPYNLTLLSGALAAAAATAQWPLAVIALGLEGIWLLNAPGSKFLRRLLWDPRIEEANRQRELEERNRRLASLAEHDRARVEALVDRQREINRLAASNPTFTADLLRTELGKTGRLVDAFVDMAITCGRYEDYLASIDVAQLERDRARWEREVRSGANDDPQTDLAKRNFAIILKRIDKMREIQKYLKTTRGQLDLIENSFQLIADQIVTMQSPKELEGQLDELLDGVESIRETAVDTEKMLASFTV